MPYARRVEPKTYRLYQRKNIDRMPTLARLRPEQVAAIKAVSAVLPFRVNNYVVEELIDWDKVPDDPIFQLTIPQEGMLEPDDFQAMLKLVQSDAPAEELTQTARRIQLRMNPHPGNQQQNIPELDGRQLAGMQHKYRQTLLFFPSEGQTCHSYCTYCFRWAQFVGLEDLKFTNSERDTLLAYLHRHHEVTDVLFTGGDPLIMRTAVLRKYIEPLLKPDMEHIHSIRLGTKAPAFWPYRFLTEPDADDLLRLFEEIVKSGRHLAVMAHYSHPRELETPAAVLALRRILDTGAVVRCQSPLIRNVNDKIEDWVGLWQLQVKYGAVPYYMFVERDTGARNYFEVPLGDALRIFQQAYGAVSGLARTVRGPIMSASPGKVLVDGVARIHGEDVFVLKFIQARDPQLVNHIFFAKYDAQAMWLDHLRPAFESESAFFETQLIGAPDGGQSYGSVSQAYSF